MPADGSGASADPLADILAAQQAELESRDHKKKGLKTSQGADAPEVVAGQQPADEPEQPQSESVGGDGDKKPDATGQAETQSVEPEAAETPRDAVDANEDDALENEEAIEQADEKTPDSQETAIDEENEDVSVQSEPSESDVAPLSPVLTEAGGRPITAKRTSSWVALLLLLNTFLVAFLVAAVLVLRPRGDSSPSNATGATIQRSAGSNGKGDISVRPDREASWKRAETLFAQERFSEAIGEYSLLLRPRRGEPVSKVLLDLFRLRIAGSKMGMGNKLQAYRTLKEIAASPSPVIRAVANYNLALADISDGYYLRARQKAYVASAALASMETSLKLEADCDFLVAYALTRKVRNYYGGQDAMVWPELKYVTPLAGMDESALRRIVEDGKLLPREESGVTDVEITAHPGPGKRWGLLSSGAPLEQVLHALASNAQRGVRWASVSELARNVPVNVWLRNVPTQRAGELTCGSVGLVARFTWDEIVVHDARSAETMYEQRDLLAGEAVSAWRRFFLRVPDDPRVPVGHFARASLLEWSGDLIGAMREYRIITRRFKRSPVAPRSLLQCAMIRHKLRDNIGARNDLLELLDGYPDYPLSDEVYLRLGRFNMEGGFLDDAIRVYTKLYFLNMSAKSRLAAALGAGKCLLKQGKFKEASKWLSLHVSALGSKEYAKMVEAYTLLAQSEAAQGNLSGAAGAYRRVLASRPTSVQRKLVLIELASLQIQRKEFVAAADVLGSLEREDLSKRQKCRAVCMRADLYRRMGIPMKAVSLLSEVRRNFRDPNLHAKIGVELARSYAEMKQWVYASQVLSDALPKMEPGVEAERAQCDLAEYYLKIGKTDQAIALMRELVESPEKSVLNRRALQIVGSAYLQQKDYTNAALALSGEMPDPPGNRNE